MTEAFALALLVSASGLGYVGREKLLAAAGSALAVVEEPRKYAHLLSDKVYGSMLEAIERAQTMERSIEQGQMHLIARGEKGYPHLLLETARAPHVLFVMGKADLQDRFPVAVVGTRQSDNYGISRTRAMAKELAEAGVCIVSGLALGVDAASHEGALDAGGRTVAVLGGALDRFYPAENKPLARRILESGGSIISEYPPGMRPSRYTFLERNRIIAGMSLGVLVTRGPLHSGAYRTAMNAIDEGREVFALPGDADNALSALPNKLIAQGANLTISSRDILDALVIEPAQSAARAGEAGTKDRKKKPATPVSAPIPPQVDGTERAVLLALEQGEQDFDTLCAMTGVPARELGSTLSMMELDGLIDALPGLRYARAQE